MQVCFIISNVKWYLDSGSSKHITRDKSLLSSLFLKKRGFVSYSDNNKGMIIGSDSIGKFPNKTIGDVLFVDGLKHN